jgi:hypothetical protein
MPSLQVYLWSAALAAIFGIIQMPDRENLNDWLLVFLFASIPYLNILAALLCFLLMVADLGVSVSTRKNSSKGIPRSRQRKPPWLR